MNPQSKKKRQQEAPKPSLGQRLSFSLWPLVSCFFSVLFYIFHTQLHTVLPGVELAILHNIAAITIFYSFSWLMARSFRAFILLQRTGTGTGRRKAPKLLSELVSVTLFTIATMLAIGVLIGKSSGGVLASSGLIIAILGFAIRNVLADVLSGIALGLEAPFRIGDWVAFDAATTGRVIEIGWRTTRVLTADDIYMILPNSQISRQMLTNYSAPRKHYQATIQIVLGHDVPVTQAKTLLKEAAKLAQNNPGMVETQKSIVRATLYGAEGISYTIRYWVSNFAFDMECRDAMLAAIDETLRKHEVSRRGGQVKLVLGQDKVVRGE
ncbi:putative mechanosensitive channel protein [Pusillimonas sp. T7-7]|uniref:mechanosensitive ion channel family protein n=1 Tax=Pusillimonas sp. (strain T7-7) TaxID=1007105 RepID=UPI0002084F69|nr:mechanosensitive ion channel domain-containing protein [Pusillimonas sp. T7-7]AEC21229.1 putative mechanosensitive channel protein [Pusillimonas sp. T7-7]